MRGVVNNRAVILAHAKALLESVKAFGHHGKKYPIIVIIKASEIPEGFQFSDEEQSAKLSFLTKTMVGIVAGAHRLLAIKLYCEEADKFIHALKEYIRVLKTQLADSSIRNAKLSEIKAKYREIQGTLDKLVTERESVAYWPTLVYDWGKSLLLSSTRFVR